jgi:uncharacterized protein YuzE
MKITIDFQADAAFIFINDEIPPGGAPRSEICDFEIKDGAVILLFSPEDRLVGLEILGASRLLPLEVLEKASRKT